MRRFLLFRYKKALMLFIAGIFLSLPFGCGKWGWEDVATDYESELNILAIISADSLVDSFVMVHQTLNLQTPSEKIEGSDTVWYGEGPDDYWIDYHYVSGYSINDADVYVIDEGDTFRFFPVVYSYYYPYDPFSFVYRDTLNLFHPRAGAEYRINIITRDGRETSGITKVPFPVEISEEELPDTILARKPITLKWKASDRYSFCRAVVKGERYIRDMQQSLVNEPGDSVWITSFDLFWLTDSVYYDTLYLEVYTVDDNYYEYFLKGWGEDEFVSFMVGAGNEGLSAGLKEGYGVIGSLAVDRVTRIAKY